jgi:hypothetical protein
MKLALYGGAITAPAASLTRGLAPNDHGANHENVIYLCPVPPLQSPRLPGAPCGNP